MSTTRRAGRRAVLLAAMDDREPSYDDLEAANAELLADGARLTRVLLGSGAARVPLRTVGSAT